MKVWTASRQEDPEPEFRQHMFLGQALVSALAERRDPRRVSCYSTSVQAAIFSRGGYFLFQRTEFEVDLFGPFLIAIALFVMS